MNNPDAQEQSQWDQARWDQHWMQRALALAAEAGLRGEVPVGAVIVCDNQLLGEGFNQPISAQDPSAHAEVVALRAAARQARNYRLPGATLYVTIEPCAMCAGALVHARVDRLVYGAAEPKAGVVQSQDRFFERGCLNHRLQVQSGVCAEAASQLLADFFRSRRAAKKALRHNAGPASE